MKKTGVIHFIEDRRKQNIDDKQIVHDLLDAGWEMDIIQHAMHGKKSEMPTIATTSRHWKDYLYHPIFIASLLIVLILLALFA